MLLSQYRWVLYFQYFLLLLDLSFNSFSNLARAQPSALLILFVIQDVCIVLAIIVVFILFFNTYIFQAGLINILISKFRAPIFIVVVYLGLTVGLQVWSLTLIWNNPFVFISNGGFLALYVIQRLVSVLYYYSYKRTALRLSDPRFYEVTDWILAEFEKRF